MKVSICICSFDRQEELDRLLQWYENSGPLDDLVEAIYVVDDASPIVLQAPEHCAGVPVVLYRNANNLGLIGARNTLIRLALPDKSGSLFFNDDDLYIYRLRDGIVAAISAIGEGNSVASIPYIDMPATDKAQFAAFGTRRTGSANNLTVSYFFGGSCVVSKSAFEKVGLFVADYRIYLEEEDFALRLASVGMTMVTLWGGKAFGIHDHGRGKQEGSRARFLVSNRLLFLRRFVGRRRLAFFFWCGAYLSKYLLKYRSLQVLRDAMERYAAMRDLPIFSPGQIPGFSRLMLRRLL